MDGIDVFARALVEASVPRGADAFVPTHRHSGGGLCRVMHRGTQADGVTEVVVVQGADGHIWVVPAAAFTIPASEATQFTPIAHSDAPDGTAAEAGHALLRAVARVQALADRGSVAWQGAAAVREWAALCTEATAASAEAKALRLDRDSQRDLFRYTDLKLDLALDDVRALRAERDGLKRTADASARQHAALKAVQSAIAAVEYMVKYNEWFNSTEWRIAEQTWEDTKRKVSSVLSAS